MTYMRVRTQTGVAMIVMTEVVAIVRHHSSSREIPLIDLHMRSGTIFVIPDFNEADYNALLDMWEMFNREQWGDPYATEHPAPRSPGYVEGGKMHEL